jgi:mannose-6-phosphate isomerase-like protein (cupin superfamily)
MTLWTRHRGDELLSVVQGAVKVTVLLDDGALQRTPTEGSVFVVPAGPWHCQAAKGRRLADVRDTRRGHRGARSRMASPKTLNSKLRPRC